MTATAADRIYMELKTHHIFKQFKWNIHSAQACHNIFMPWFIVFQSTFTFIRKPIPIQWTTTTPTNERTNETNFQSAKKIKMQEKCMRARERKSKEIFFAIKLLRKFILTMFAIAKRNIEIHIRSCRDNMRVVCLVYIFHVNCTHRKWKEKHCVKFAFCPLPQPLPLETYITNVQTCALRLLCDMNY